MSVINHHHTVQVVEQKLQQTKRKPVAHALRIHRQENELRGDAVQVGSQLHTYLAPAPDFFVSFVVGSRPVRPLGIKPEWAQPHGYG